MRAVESLLTPGLDAITGTFATFCRSATASRMVNWPPSEGGMVWWTTPLNLTVAPVWKPLPCTVSDIEEPPAAAAEGRRLVLCGAGAWSTAPDTRKVARWVPPPGGGLVTELSRGTVDARSEEFNVTCSCPPAIRVAGRLALFTATVEAGMKFNPEIVTTCEAVPDGTEEGERREIEGTGFPVAAGPGRITIMAVSTALARLLISQARWVACPRLATVEAICTTAATFAAPPAASRKPFVIILIRGDFLSVETVHAATSDARVDAKVRHDSRNPPRVLFSDPAIAPRIRLLSALCRTQSIVAPGPSIPGTAEIRLNAVSIRFMLQASSASLLPSLYEPALM